MDGRLFAGHGRQPGGRWQYAQLQPGRLARYQQAAHHECAGHGGRLGSVSDAAQSAGRRSSASVFSAAAASGCPANLQRRAGAYFAAGALVAAQAVHTAPATTGVSVSAGQPDRGRRLAVDCRAEPGRTCASCRQLGVCTGLGRGRHLRHCSCLAGQISPSGCFHSDERHGSGHGIDLCLVFCPRSGADAVGRRNRYHHPLSVGIALAAQAPTHARRPLAPACQTAPRARSAGVCRRRTGHGRFVVRFDDTQPNAAKHLWLFSGALAVPGRRHQRGQCDAGGFSWL